MNEYTKVYFPKYKDAKVIPANQEVPLEMIEMEEYLMENRPHTPKFCPECGTKAE